MSKLGTGQMRLDNYRKVIEVIQQDNIVDKKQVAEKTNLTVATVGTILNVFREKEIIKEKSKRLNQKGRPTVQYQLNPDFFHYLNLIFYKKESENFLAIEVHNAKSDCLFQDEQKMTELDESTLKTKLLPILKDDPDIQLIVVGLPALISEDSVIESDISAFKGKSIKTWFEALFNLPIIVKNDMNLCALGYYEQLDSKEDISYMWLPEHDGPGCGTVINGKLLEGRNQIAGEVIYLPFFNFLKSQNVTYTEDIIAKTIVSLSALMNPSQVVLVSQQLHQKDLIKIKSICHQYLPANFMPQLFLKKEYLNDYFKGMAVTATHFYWMQFAF